MVVKVCLEGLEAHGLPYYTHVLSAQLISYVTVPWLDISLSCSRSLAKNSSPTTVMARRNIPPPFNAQRVVNETTHGKIYDTIAPRATHLMRNSHKMKPAQSRTPNQGLLIQSGRVI